VNSMFLEYFPVVPPEGAAPSLAPFFTEYQALRERLMTILSDGDLRYRVGGANPSLGELCREIGEIEYSYIESFKTFAADFRYRSSDPELVSSVAALSAWYAELDAELRSTIEGLSEDDVANRTVHRSDLPGFAPRLPIQLDIYKEALLIFYGKVDVYLRVLEKEPPQQWREWIA